MGSDLIDNNYKALLFKKNIVLNEFTFENTVDLEALDNSANPVQHIKISVLNKITAKKTAKKAYELFEAKKYKQSMKTYEKLFHSAYRGYASYMIGTLYHNGYEVEKNIPNALYFYKTATAYSSSYCPAYAQLGRIFQSGEGVQMNQITAYEFYSMGANQFMCDNIESIALMGLWYCKGNMKEYITTAYHDNYVLEITNDHLPKGYDITIFSKMLSDVIPHFYNEFELQYIKKLTKQEFDNAIKHLIDMYFKSLHFDNDDEYIQIPVFKEAYRVLGELYYYRAFIPIEELEIVSIQFIMRKTDTEMVELCFTRAGLLGDKNAAFMLGTLYKNGILLKQDQELAEKWFKMAE